MCAFRIRHDPDPFKCIMCVGEDNFFQERSDKAKRIYDATEQALAPGLEYKTTKRRADLQTLLFDFGQTVDLLNRLDMYSVLQPMWPLLLRVVKYQESIRLEGHLETLQTVRFHAQPADLHNELVQLVAKQSAHWAKKRPSSAEKKANGLKLTRSKKPTIAFVFHDVHGLHPILQLLRWPLLQLLKRPDLNVLILATQEPNTKVPIVRELHSAFDKKGCWHQITIPPVTPDQLDQKVINSVRKQVRDLAITALIDCVGNGEGPPAFRALLRPGLECHKIIYYLNSPTLPCDSDFYSYVLLDPWLLKALPNAAGADKACLISCWQPVLEDCVRVIRRDERKLFVEGSGQRFGIHTPVDLTRISEQCLEDLLQLLVDLEDTVLFYFGNPLTQISATRRNMEAFAERRGLCKEYFNDRVEWWGFLPMAEHGQRLRDQVHVCYGYGSASGHTGMNLALCAGTVVVTAQGSCGGGDVAAWVAAGMLYMLGLGALAVPYGGRPLDLVKQFYYNGELLMTVQGILDHHARTSTSFFDTERTANDLADFVCALHTSDSFPAQNEWKFVSCAAEVPYLVVGEGGILQKTARALVRAGNDALGAEPLPEPMSMEEPGLVDELSHGAACANHGEDQEMDERINYPTVAEPSDSRCAGDAGGADVQMKDLIDSTADMDVPESASSNNVAAVDATGVCPSAGDLTG
jgi:hypothetical protein